MATCGWLMMGVPKRPPKTPGLVMVNVPPATSSGFSCLARARSKRLSPDEVQQGTFTITNPGIFGALYGLPLINQPQVAILGVGTIEKRPVVIDDAIGIRPMCHLTLGYDHRLIDGADAGRFLTFVKERLEKFEL